MKPKNIILLLLAATSLLSGIVVQYFRYARSHAPVELWFIGIFAFLIFFWYRLDTDQHAYRRTPLLNIAVMALAAVALPYYFFRSRGAKGGFASSGFFVVAVVCSSILTIAGQYVIYYYYVLQS